MKETDTDVIIPIQTNERETQTRMKTWVQIDHTPVLPRILILTIPRFTFKQHFC